MASEQPVLVLLALGALGLVAYLVLQPPAPPPPVSTPQAEGAPRSPTPAPPIDERALREDIRRLVEGGGQLPPGYVPSGSIQRAPSLDEPGHGPALGGAALAPVVVRTDGAAGVVLAVRALAPDSPAARAGLAVGDHVLALGDEAPTPSAVLAARDTLRKGGQLRLRVRRRNGDTMTIEMNPGGT